ncbi:MAG: PfkB family carbohydrate kinase [Christensenellales bacterium]
MAKGVEYVVISMGGDGLLGISADKAYKVEVPKIAVRSTVGAGDSVVAGTLMALSSGEPFEKAICMGAAFPPWPLPTARRFRPKHWWKRFIPDHLPQRRRITTTNQPTA